jgi:hypothetical protein
MDAVTHIADHMFVLAQGEDDAFLLIGIHLGKEGRPLDSVPDGFVGHVVRHLAGQQPRNCQMDGLRNMPGCFLVIASDDLEMLSLDDAIFLWKKG